MPEATARIVPSSWMPSFDFSIKQPPAVSKTPTVSKPPGRDWEGAAAPLPIEHDVSEANSELGGLGGANGKLSTGRPSVFVKTSVKRVLRKKKRA